MTPAQSVSPQAVCRAPRPRVSLLPAHPGRAQGHSLPPATRPGSEPGPPPHRAPVCRGGPQPGRGSGGRVGAGGQKDPFLPLGFPGPRGGGGARAAQDVGILGTGCLEWGGGPSLGRPPLWGQKPLTQAGGRRPIRMWPRLPRTLLFVTEDEGSVPGEQCSNTRVPSLFSHGTSFSETPMPGRPRAPPTRARSP